MSSKIRNLLIIIVISLLPTILIWLPFFLRVDKFWGIPLRQDGMAAIVANYDGPLYIVVAKTLYNPDLIGGFGFNLPSEYYAAHFPLFPYLIKTFAAPFGFPYSMLFVTLMSSILAIYFFYLFIREFVSKENALWITFLFSVFPARWLIVRSVGSPEPLFLATIIASVHYFRKKNFLLAGLWGFLAQLTKSPGILLFPAYFLATFIPDFKNMATATSSNIAKSLNFKKYISISLIPLALLAVFIFYKFQLADFFAYFHSGDNIHLFFPPFQIFNYAQPWVGTFWLEEVIFVYLFGILGLIKLAKSGENELAWVVGLFFTSTLFVSHRDLIRYSLPILPFLFAAFSETLTRKEFRLVFLTLAIPIYLFALAYISQNVMPISDWAPLL